MFPPTYPALCGEKTPCCQAMDPGSKADGYPAESSYQVKVVGFRGGLVGRVFGTFVKKKSDPGMVHFVKKRCTYIIYI